MSHSLSLVKRYSIKPKDQIFLKGYVLLSFVKNMDKNKIKI